jgi:tetratricopeptide (TPR) repeat protein
MNLRQTLLLAFVALMLLSPPSHAAESDDLWARALFLSSCDTTTVQQSEVLFLKALQKVDRKGPIFVSLGDYYSGPAPMRQAAHSISASVQDDIRPDVEKEAETLVASDGKPSNGEIERVAESLSKLVSQSFRDHLGEMEDAITRPQSKALLYYLAAVAEDPKLSIAWFRIASNQQADDKLKQKARSNFIMWNPDNALPHYLEAFEDLDQEQLPSALLSLRKGNRKTLRVPHTPMPERFHFAFPQTKLYRDAGVAGKPVPLAILRAFALENDTFVSLPFNGKLRHLARQLVKRGAVLADAGKTDEAIRYLESVATLGLRIIQNEGRDTILPLVGFAITDLAANDLRALYEAANQEEKAKRLDDFKKARKTYVSEFSAFMKSSSSLFDSDTEILKNCRKFEDYQKKEKEIVLRLLNKTGLNTFSFEK